MIRMNRTLAWLVVFVAILSFAVPDASGQTVPCNYFYANPGTYYAPPGTLVEGGSPPAEFTPGTVYYGGGYMESYPSFVVTATYVNNCSEAGWVGSGFGSDVSSLLMTDPFLGPGSAMMGLYDYSSTVPAGGSVTLPFAWYVWSPDAPIGSTWTATINATDWGTAQFTATVTGPPADVPEPSTLWLVGTGISTLAVWLRKAKRK